MKDNYINTHAEEWRAKRNSMPSKSWIITFTMDDGKKFFAYDNAKDEYDIRQHWKHEIYVHYPAHDSGKSFVLPKNKIMYIEIEEVKS